MEQEPFCVWCFALFGPFWILFGFGTFLNPQANMNSIDLDQHCPTDIRFKIFQGATLGKQKE